MTTGVLTELAELKFTTPYLLKCRRRIPIFILFLESRIVTLREMKQETSLNKSGENIERLHITFDITLEEPETLPHPILVPQ